MPSRRDFQRSYQARNAHHRRHRAVIDLLVLEPRLVLDGDFGHGGPTTYA